MSKLVQHARQNVVAYLALFVALGGTSYAAISIPRNSVGANQIRNHSVQPVKLDGKYFGGYIRLWARIDSNGHIIASSPGARVIVWYPPSSVNRGGQIQWSERVSQSCFALANTESLPGPSSASVTAESLGRHGELVGIALSASDPVNVAVICPHS